MEELINEKMVKIISVSGLAPREFVDKKGEVYLHEDEIRETVNTKGQVVKATYAVYEIPEELAKFKLSQMPDRYKLYGTSKILRYPTVTPEGARSFITSIPVTFKMQTKAILDPETGQPKTKRGSKEPMFHKCYELVAKGNKPIVAKPYAIEIVEDEEQTEKSDKN